jgi:hypothetical protein
MAYAALGQEYLGVPSFVAKRQQPHTAGRGEHTIVCDQNVSCKKPLAGGLVLGRLFLRQSVDSDLDEIQHGYTILHCDEADPEPHSHGSVVSFSGSLRHKHDLSELLDDLLNTANLEKALDQLVMESC